MALLFRDLMFEVRSELGELNQFDWSDNQLIRDINNTVKDMCSVAGALTKFVQPQLVTTPGGGYQECALEDDLDGILSCKYYQGQLYDLEYADWDQLQNGAATGSIPLYYYTKTGTKQLTPQSMGTSDITPINIDIQNGSYRTVVGVWPISPYPGSMRIWYTYFHPWMMDPLDPCLVPNRFLEGITAGVLKRCRRMEKALDEADYYSKLYEGKKEEFRIYAARKKQSNKPARYGMEQDAWRNNPSSSIIFIDPNPMGP